MSTSFSKKIALWFALDLWSENNPKIPVLLEIQVKLKLDIYGIESEEI